MRKVEIFGPGCSKCKFVEKRVAETVEELGIEAEIRKITDISEMTERGIMLTPAVAVDGKLKSEGRIPTREEIKNWLS